MFRTSNVTLDNQTVCIKQFPSCTCSFFLFQRRNELCKHILIVNICLGVSSDNFIIRQISYTEEELSGLLKSVLDQSHLQKLKRETVSTILHCPYKAYLVLYARSTGRRASCQGCRSTLEYDVPIIEIEGRYKCGTNSFRHKFRYCGKYACFKSIPRNSDIKSLPAVIYVQRSITDQEYSRIEKDGLKLERL